MNFDKNHVARKKSIPTGTRIFRRISLTALKIFLVLLLFCVILGTAAGVGMIKGLIASAPNIDSLSVAPAESATYIYNTGNKPVQKLAESTSNRILVKLDQIPEDLQHAIVAVEDERFYRHHGIDIQGIARAAVIGITSGDFSEGASTITQQLIKNNVFTDWVTQTALSQKLRRKFQEQYLALQLEKKMSKDQILQDYLNTINLGASSYGVQAAAKRYFNKDVSQLNLSESTVIAGITQNPTLYNPIINPDENAKRRKIILQKMVEQGYISEQQQQDALADDVYSRIQKTAQETDEVSIYSYYTDALIEQVMDDLVEVKGYTRQQAYKAVYSGGLKIYSNQDEEIQKICDEEFANPENYPSVTLIGLDYALSIQKSDGEIINYSSEMLRSWFQKQDSSFNMMFDDEESAKAAAETYKNAMVEKGDTVLGERVSLVPQPQASVVIIDNETGYVKAIIGGRGTKTASLTLNRATDSTRQPGSTFKIVSTYAAALNEKGMTLATTYEDQPITYDNGAPVNNASGSFNGTTTIRTAINTVAVQCFEDVTPELGLKYLDNFGFTTLAHGTEADTDANGNVYTDANLPTALGGLTYGVKNVELCAAYAAIANGGNYIKPVYYTKILDHNGNVLIENNSVGRSVIKETTAYLLTSALEDVVQNGTGTACQLDNMAVAGKTGTTDAYNDLWFVGYTPYYTCAVWSGYDGNQKIPEGDARNFHKTLWRKVMNRIHQGMEYKDFEVPDGIEQISICADTGLLPRVGCPVTEEYFDVGTMPTEYCDQHFYEYDESQDEDMEIYDANATPTPDPENPDGTDNADGSGGDGTGGDGTGGDGTGGDGTDGGDIQYPDESGGDSGNDDIYYY